MAKKFYSLLPAIILSTLGVIILVFAWTEPTNSPPQGNVPAPLNVGLEGQIKEGGLWIASNPTLNTGLIVQYGNVGIGTTTPSYKLDVVGKANAEELCISGDCKSSWAFVGESVGFGDGSDGDVTISSDTSLSRDMYYNNLTINPGVTLNPNGYRIFVKGTLINNGKISRNGNPGEDGDVADCRSTNGGAPLSSGTLFGSVGGGKGGWVCVFRAPGVSGFYNYPNGEGGGSVVGIGNNGGRGGGGAGAPGSGGTVTKDDFYFLKRYIININSNFVQENLPQISQLIGYSLTNRELFGGGGGGGGGAASGAPDPSCIGTCRNTSAGGGGGSAGGVIYIGAKKIINNGVIEAKGGNGGKGGRNSYNSSNADQVCGGGGGGGGAGGIVILVYNSYEGGGSIDVSGGIGGDPGPQGSCSTPAERGQDGAPGKVIKIQVP